MKIYFTHIIALRLENGEPSVCYSEKIPTDKRVYPHGNGSARTEDIHLGRAIESFLRKENLQHAFASYYQENIDTSVSNPFYPSWELRTTKEIQNFIKNYPEYLVLIFQDEVNLNIQLQ